MNDDHGSHDEEDFQRRMTELTETICAEAVEDVEGLVWSVVDEEGEAVVRTQARDPLYQAHTNVVDIIGRAVVERRLVERDGATPIDGVSAARVVQMLNEPNRFGMRPMLPSPDDEDNPDFTPRFQLCVEDLEAFASLAEPTWNEVGRLHTFPLPPDDPEDWG